MKRKLKFEDYKSYLKVAWIERTINHLEKKIKINVYSLKGDKKRL